MAVLVEAISVIVRRDAIDRIYPGGWVAFARAVPNATLCADEDIARVGFMAPAAAKEFVETLKSHGLVFIKDGRATDIAVVDQQRGPTTKCEWLEFGKLPFSGLDGKISACWLFDEPRRMHGLHIKGTSMTLATPPGWNYEGSLSQKFHFVPTGEEANRLRFLRREDGLDVYLELSSGKEVYLAR